MSPESRRSPQRPPVSPISINSDDEDALPPSRQPTVQDARMTGTTAVNTTRAQIRTTSTRVGITQAHRNLNLALTNTAAANQVPMFLEQGIDDLIADVVKCGLHFMGQIRTHPKLGLDANFQKMLRDPMPTAKKPLVVPANAPIPEDIIKYFMTLTFHTNKIMAVLYIWLDLYRMDIYIPFTMVCDIQIGLMQQSESTLQASPGPLHTQIPATQIWTLGLFASANLLHHWAHTEAGKKQIETMEMTVEKKRSSDDKTTDRMMQRLQAQQWIHYLDGPKGSWLNRVHQRLQ